MGDVCQSLALPPREVLGLADWCALLEWLDGERVLPAAYVGSQQ